MGFIASLSIFKSFYSRLENDEKIAGRTWIGVNMNSDSSYIDIELINRYKSQFTKLMEGLNFDLIEVDSISSSRSGAKKIYDLLTKS